MAENRAVSSHPIFTRQARARTFLGPAGVGKSFLAQALGHVAVRAGHNVRFSHADDFAMAQAPVDNSVERTFRSFLAPDLLILDNGSVFAQHHLLHQLGIETFFCDTHSPWQKGGVENANLRLRRRLPRQTDLLQLPQEIPYQLIQACNNAPRKCLGFLTLAEFYAKQVLHLKCESTYS